MFDKCHNTTIKVKFLLSLACDPSSGILYHVTSGTGTPVTLQISVTVSPSLTVVSRLDSSLTILDGTERKLFLLFFTIIIY